MASRLSADARRRQLLDVAASHFAGHGFHAASMAELADLAGVTKPVVYQHFRSKRDLYREVVEDSGRRLLDAILARTAAAAGPREQVEAGFEAYFRFVDEHPDAFHVLFGSDARRDGELLAAVDGVERAIADTIAGLIEAGLDDDHRVTLGHAIVGLGEVVGRRWLAGGRTTDAASIAAEVADLAWNGLRGVHPHDHRPPTT
ncbi:MAG TPA: TetR/AcrR family transcriptional regulator [Acidimicrobiales bacterium]|jgi:AcrR family transcriptional regulator